MNRRLFKVSAVCAGLLSLALFGKVDVSESATIWGSANEIDKVSETYCKLLNSGGDYYYQTAYEVYDSTFGATSERAGIKIVPDSNINKNVLVHLQLKGAKFNPPAVQGVAIERLRYVLLNSLALDPNNVVAATTQAITISTNNLSFRTLSDIASGTPLYLGVAEVDGNGSFVKVHYFGASYYIEPGLGATCTKTADVLIGFTAPNDTGSGVLIRILPKLGYVSTNLGLNFNAELDTDKDFKQFVGGTILDTCCSRGKTNCAPCVSGQCVERFQQQQPSVCGNRQWIVGSNIDASMINATISFTINSLVPQPGIQKMEIWSYDNSTVYGDCVADTSRQNWTCSATGNIFDDNKSPCIKVHLDGTTENSHTLWSLTNVSISGLSYSGGIKNLCYTIPSTGSLGSWHGGLEAIVPFVKKSPDGFYNTYIKFINRYNKPAKVYAQPFKNASSPMIITTTLIGTIPANGGVLTLDAGQLANIFSLTSNEIDAGMPFKFVIRVPSQTECGSIFGSVKDYSSFSGTVCNNNPNDPYVEGIVVSASPQGQRTIPLKFRHWKNGSYSH